MTRTCENCLNAYNSSYDTAVRCWNKEFEAQFHDIDVTVRKDETCGTWQRRNDNQKAVNFHQTIQLTLF